MIRHVAIVCGLVALLVGSLFYCMSPDDMRIACAGMERKISDAAAPLLAALPGGALHMAESRPLAPSAPPRRNLDPDPFRPFARRRPSIAVNFSKWISRPEALWMMPAAAAFFWLGRRVGKRRARFAAEQKMAATLMKAVRQMTDRPERNLRTLHHH